MSANEEPGKRRDSQERPQPFLDRVYDRLFHNYIWQSVFRSGYPNTPRNQILAIATSVFLHLHPTRLHRTHVKITHTYCLGGLAFFMFLILTVTGILLMFYYVPSTDRAYTDIAALETNVEFGMLMRNLHRWTAHAMVILVFLHMMRVFYTGAYKPPHEFNWVVGVILLVLTLLLSFTGYLLPWDQLALWAVTVGTNMVGSAPYLGDDVRLVLLGGYEVGEAALIRFYTLHVLALPLLAAIFMAVHFWRIRRDGGMAEPL
jgi:cytochrome b6